MRNQTINEINKVKRDATEHLSKLVEHGLEIELGEIIRVPFDSESENHIAFSFISKVSFEIESEKTEKLISTTGATILAKNRIIFVYVNSIYSSVDDLTWTQDILEKWVTAIIEANSIAPSSAAKSYSDFLELCKTGSLQQIVNAFKTEQM
jgi:hypothetical protein